MRATGIDEDLLSALGVLEGDDPDVRDLTLSGIRDPDGDDLVTDRQGVQRLLPAAGRHEIADENHHRGTADEPARLRQRARQVGRAPPPPPPPGGEGVCWPSVARSIRAISCSSAVRPADGGMIHRTRSSKSNAPTRLPRPISSCPTTAENSSASCRLRQRAVPQSSERVISTSNQASRPRSGSDSRT